MSSQRGAALKEQRRKDAAERARARERAKAQQAAKERAEREYTAQAADTQRRLREDFYARNPHLIS